MPNREDLYLFLEKKYGPKNNGVSSTPIEGSKVSDEGDALQERMRLSSSLRDMTMGTQMRNIHNTIEDAITSNPTHLYNYLSTDDDSAEQPSQGRGKALTEKIQPTYNSVKGEDKDFVASKYVTADKLVDELYPASEDGTIEIDGYKYPKTTVSKVMRGIVEDTMHPELFATNKAYRSNYFMSNFGKDEQTYYTERLSTLDKELNDLLQMIRNESAKEAQSMTSATNQFGYSQIATPAMQLGLQESMGANIIRDAIDQINSLKKGNVWSGINEGFDWVSALTLSLNDIASSASLSRILDKVTEDKPLTPREQLAFKAYTLSKEVDSISDIVGRKEWNEIGATLGKISEFALPMAAPVKLATTGVKMTSLGVKEAIAATSAVAKNSISKAIGTGLLETVKVGGRLGANVARAEVAGAMLAPFTPTTWANFAEKRLQQYSINDNGKVEFKPSLLWKDIVDTEIEQTQEIASEIFGMPLQNIIGKSAKTFGRLIGLDVVADKIGFGADKRFLLGLRKPAATRELERTLGFAGLLGEGSSEVLGEYLSESLKSVITGNGDVSRLNNWDFWKNTLLVSTLYGGALSVATLPLTVSEYTRSNIYKASKARGVALSRIDNRELRNRLLSISAIDDMEVASQELAQLDWGAMPRKDIAAAMDFVRADYTEKVLLGDVKESMRMNAYAGVAFNTAQCVYCGEDGQTPTDDIISIDTEDGRYMVISGTLDNASDSELICRDANGKIVPIHASKIKGIYKHSLQEEMGEQYKRQFGVQIEQDRQQEVIEKLNKLDKPTKEDIANIMASFGAATHQQGEQVTLVDGRKGVVDSLEDDGAYVVEVKDNTGVQLLSVPFYDVLAEDATMAEAQQRNYTERSISNIDEYAQKVEETAPEERNGISIGDMVTTPDGHRGRVLSFNDDGTITIDENLNNTSGNLADAYAVEVAEAEAIKEDVVSQVKVAEVETPAETISKDVEETTPQPTMAQEIKPIPRKEDGSVDYDAIDDPAMFAEQFSKDMGGAEAASVQLAKMMEASRKEIEKLTAKGETLTAANEVVSNRKAVEALNNKAKLYSEVIKELNPEPKAGVIENEYSLQLDPKFKKFINTMAEAFGLTVEFVEDIKGNAQISGNKVKISWEHRDKGIKFLIGHEFTHRMQDLSPEQYAKFKESAKEFLGEEAWNERLARMKQTYIYNKERFDRTLLEDEVVADFVGQLVEQADAFDRYINSVEDKGILATIAKVLRSIRDFIFNAEAEAAKPLTEMLDKLDTFIESAEATQYESKEMERVDEIFLQDGVEMAQNKSRYVFSEDKQGNPVNANGSLILEEVSSIGDITDNDFNEPSRNIMLPSLPKNVQDALGANGKRVVIKKNIFERNAIRHSDITPEQSRDILNAALYSPNLYGQNQKSKKPHNWVVISVKSDEGANKLVLLEVNNNREYIEVVHWHYVDNRGIEKIKRQAEREDGQLLILPPENSGEVGALSDPTLSMSSESKDTTSIPKNQTNEQKFSLITPEMDAAYMDAVNNGDMETAQQMVMEAAKLAMPNTKVVDENGNPKVVYHGDRKKARYIFSTDTFFTPKAEYAKRYTNGTGEVYATFLDIKSPFDIRDKKAYDIFTEFRGGRKPVATTTGAMDWGEYSYEDLQEYVEDVAPNEYDGFILDEGADPDGNGGVVHRGLSFVPFTPNQIKSADPVTYDDNGNVIPLSERFNPEKEDIRYSLFDVEVERFNRKLDFIKGLVREYNIPNPVFIAETKEEFVQMVKDYGGEVNDDTPEAYGVYIPDDDIILLNGGKLITSGDAHRSTMHEYVHSITKKYLGERLAEITSSIPEKEIDKARKEMLPEAYSDYSYSEVIDEFTSLLLEDLSMAETRAIFEGEMAIDTFIEKLKNDIKGIEKISNKDILYAVIPLVVDNLKIQKEQYGKDPESTIIIPRQDSRRYTTIGQASHLSGDKKSRPSEAESRVYEDSRGGEGSQKEVTSRYALLSAPITEEEQIRIYLRQKHLKNKEDIRKKYRTVRSVTRMDYNEWRAKRSARLKSMRSYAAKVEYILGDLVEATLPFEHQALAKIARGEIKMPWEALSKELGLKKGEKRFYTGITNGADANTTFDGVVHQWWQELGGYESEIDTQDLRNALIDALSTASSSTRALSELREIYDKDIQIKDHALDAADLMEDEELAAEDARYAEEKERFNANKDTAVEEFVRTSSFYNQIEVVDATVMQIRERLEKTEMALAHRQQKRYYQGLMQTIAELKQSVKDIVTSKTIEVLDRNALRRVIDKIDKARSVSEVDSVLAEIEEISLNATINAQMKNMGRMLQLRLPDGVSVEEWVNAQVKEGRLSRADGDAILRDKWKGRNAKGVSVAKKVDPKTAAVLERLGQYVNSILAIKKGERVADSAIDQNKERVEELETKKIAAERKVPTEKFTEEEDVELQARQLFDKFLQTEMLKKDADLCLEVRGEIEQHYYGIAGKEAVRDKYLEENRKSLNEINRQRKEVLEEFNDALLSYISTGRDALSMFRQEQSAHKAMVVNMALDALGVDNRLVYNAPNFTEKMGAFVRSVPNAPYYTFQTTLREIDRLSPNGEGRFYNYFMSAWANANNNFITQHNSNVEAVANALSRILGVKGKNDAEIIIETIERSDDKPLLTVSYGGENAISKASPETKVLTLSNALYVIAMWRQSRYRASMEYHGFTQEMFDTVYDAVMRENKHYITFIDWVNETLLPETRLIYDKVHKEMFGASMANERNYFPARLVNIEKTEDVSLNDVGALPSTMTGAIVNRVNSKNMINLNMNYFRVLMSHLQEMDQWSTFAPLIQDLNAIVSNGTFKQSCNTIKSGANKDRSGAGSLFTLFKTVSAIAVNCYRPSHSNSVEDFLISVTRGWAGANITYRVSTALKQLASSPVFAVYATDLKCVALWAKNSAQTFVQQRKTLEWAIANSPMFKKRWDSKFAGMDIFESIVRESDEGVYNAIKSSTVGKGARAIDDAITKFATDWGMTPNAFIDAMTVANGIRTIYEYEIYLAEKRNGGKPATEKQKNEAMIKAEIAFNESQQSSESAFVSQWQTNRTFVTRALSTYQNSAYGFHRLRTAAANEYWKQIFSDDYINRLVDVYGPEQAKAIMKDARKKAFAQLLQGTIGDMLFVMMGASGTVPLFTLVGGDDDEGETWDLLKVGLLNIGLNVTTGGYALGSLFNSGLFGYSVSLTSAWDNLVTKVEALRDYDIISLPFAYQALNIVATYRYGVDFDTLTNIVTGIEGLVENESKAVATMKILNIPQSQINLVAGKRREGETVQEYVARRLRAESIGSIPYVDAEGNVKANKAYWQNPLTPRKSYVAKYKGEYEESYRRSVITKFGGNNEYREFVKNEEEYKDVVKALGWRADTKPNNNAYINGKYSIPPINGLSEAEYGDLWYKAAIAAEAAKAEEKFVGTDDCYYGKLKELVDKRQKLIDRYNEL